MNPVAESLDRFRKRVRWLNAWRGLAIGVCVGAALASGWACLDWARIWYTNWRGLGLLACLGGIAGLVAGLLRRVPDEALARSIDVRARLKDRVKTAVEVRPSTTVFDRPQSEDARRALESVVPESIYPVRLSRWHIAALALMVLAASIFLLGNSPVVHGPKTPSERAELKVAGQKVERVAAPVAEAAQKAQAPTGTKLASDLTRFAQELENGRLNREEALRKANDLAKQAEQEAKDRADTAQQRAQQAETALSKYQAKLAEDSGLKPEDLEKTNLTPDQEAALDQAMRDSGISAPAPQLSSEQLKNMGLTRTAERLSQMTPNEREKLRQAAAVRQAAIQKEIDRIDKLPPAERKAAEQERARLQQQLRDAQKLGEALKLTDEQMKALRELMQMPEMKQLQELLAKMRQKSQQMAQEGKAPTKEDLEELKKQIEELTQAMKDPKAREEIRKALEDALKQMQSGKMSLDAMQAMMTSLGMIPSSQQGQSGSSDDEGAYGKTDDDSFANTGRVNKSQHEMETKGQTSPVGVRGQWRNDKGEEWSVSVKAPTQVGNRSSVPYQKVLPTYRKAAEKAMSGGKIPKDQEKRVKEYFESLSGGK